MQNSDVRSIWPLTTRSDKPFELQLPGSKSYTNRALILSSLVPGKRKISGGLACDDTRRLAEALSAFGGLEVDETTDGFVVSRHEGVLTAPDNDVFMEHGGTPARFLLAFATTASGSTTVSGSEQLSSRPFGGLVDSLSAAGAKVSGTRLPITVSGPLEGSVWTVDGSESSQHVSALLLVAAGRDPGQVTDVRTVGLLGSRSYVDMTVHWLRLCGVPIDESSPGAWTVTATANLPDEMIVEGDASSATYPMAAAAITGTEVRLDGVGSASLQGDIGMTAILRDMGCTVTLDRARIAVSGGTLSAVSVDMSNLPDAVPALAVVAAAASGTTRIEGIAGLRRKESDRIQTTSAFVSSLGASVRSGDDFLEVTGTPEFSSAAIYPHDDHRIAMAGALGGLSGQGVQVRTPGVVSKSWPGYWDFLERFSKHHSKAGNSV